MIPLMDIKRAAGDANSVNYEAITYEGYGPNRTAIIVEALTDNKNRTAANVRSAFTKELVILEPQVVYPLCSIVKGELSIKNVSKKGTI